MFRWFTILVFFPFISMPIAAYADPLCPKSDDLGCYVRLAAKELAVDFGSRYSMLASVANKPEELTRQRKALKTFFNAKKGIWTYYYDQGDRPSRNYKYGEQTIFWNPGDKSDRSQIGLSCNGAVEDAIFRGLELYQADHGADGLSNVPVEYLNSLSVDASRTSRYA
jgi:hypothetical protein